MAEQPILEIRQAKVRYGKAEKGVHALQGVDLTLREGECLGLAGESGCGKSTLAHLVSGLLPEGTHISHDQFLINGTPAPPPSSRKWKKFRASFVSMIFQDPMGTLNPFWTIGQQMRETLLFHHIATSKFQAMDFAEKWMDQVQIKEPKKILKSFPHQLSGGMCQRVNLALALCTHPKLLIADEPTTALDVTTQKTVLDLISGLSRNSGMAVLLVSHDLGVLSERSDHLSVMYAGKTVEWGTSPQVMSSPQHPYTQALIKAQPPLKGPLPDRLAIIEGQPPQSFSEHQRCPFLNRCAHVDNICHNQFPPIKGHENHSHLCHREFS